MNGVTRWGPTEIEVVSLEEETPGMMVTEKRPREDSEKDREKVAICKARGEASGTSPADTFLLNFCSPEL